MRARIVKRVETTGIDDIDLAIERLRKNVSDILLEKRLKIQYNLNVTGTNWATTKAVGVVHERFDEANNIMYWLEFNISGVLSAAAASITITVDGVSFEFSQAVNHSDNDSASSIEKQETVAGTAQIVGESSAATTEKYFSGTVLLRRKPTWYREI